MMDPSLAGSGFDRWNQPSPLKRIKVEPSQMDVDNSSERNLGDDAMLSALNNPENYGFVRASMQFL